MSRSKKVASFALAGAGLAFALWIVVAAGQTTSGSKPSPTPVYSGPNAELGIRGRQGRILDKDYFVINWNPAWRSAFWVAECLTPADLKVKANRKGVPFYVDPELPESLAVSPKDYTGSGFDRGHLAPAADFSRSKAAMKACFVMSNMHAQYPALNRESWRLLEEAVRDSVKVKAKVWIVTGQLVAESFLRRIGNTHWTAVPSHSFKVICMLDRSGNYSGFGALGHNVKDGAAVDFVPIDSIETLSGFDFFVNLPDSIQKKVEAGE